MAIISNTDTTILPYNDDEMVWDDERHFYLLTDVGVKRLVGKDLQALAGSKDEAQYIRYEVSQDIQNFIARNSLMSAYKYKTWLMAKDSALRPIIKRVLADQMRYYIRSGAGLLKDMTGINISSGKVIDIANLRNNVLVSASVEQQLFQSGLLYAGSLYYSDYTEDGTW